MLNIKVNTYLESTMSKIYYAEHHVEILSHVPREKEYLIGYLLEHIDFEDKNSPLLLEKLFQMITEEKQNPNTKNDSLVDLPKKIRNQLFKQYKKWNYQINTDKVTEFLSKFEKTELLDLCEVMSSEEEFFDFEMLYDDDLGTVGELIIYQIKTEGLDKSHILSIADLEADLLDAVSFFYAPETDPNHVLELKPLITINSGIHRELEADGLTGAYHPKYRDGNYKSRVDKFEIPPSNFWYISDVYVQPYYRKQNLGRFALAMFLHHYYSFGDIVALHPYPSHDAFPKDEKNIEKAIKRLEKYFGMLQFTYYSSSANILWDNEYLLPEFFAESIYNPCQHHNGMPVDFDEEE